MITHTLASEAYSIEMKADTALVLVAEGKIEYCPGIHDHTAPDERVYHCKEGYEVQWTVDKELVS